MSYQTTPWEELAKKPSIRKTLKYIAIRGNDHYDEREWVLVSHNVTERTIAFVDIGTHIL